MKSLLKIPAQRYLILQYLNRQIRQRYQGTAFGVLWSLLTPLIMLSVYTFVFGIVFRAHFGISKNESPLDFGLALFCSLNLFNFFAEVILRSPTLMLQHSNLVKKVVFPLEILPVVTTFNALFHCLVAFVPLLFGLAISRGAIPWSILFLPLFLIPLALFSAGCALFLSALGVFVRDTQTMIEPFLSILMFGSALFYPLAAVPEPFGRFVGLNPLAVLFDSARKSVVFGIAPDLASLAFLSLVGTLFLLAGSYFFDKSKPAFADVM
jgi:lipopolysaccharide transport system permease protein